MTHRGGADKASQTQCVEQIPNINAMLDLASHTFQYDSCHIHDLNAQSIEIESLLEFESK